MIRQSYGFDGINNSMQYVSTIEMAFYIFALFIRVILVSMILSIVGFKYFLISF